MGRQLPPGSGGQLAQLIPAPPDAHGPALAVLIAQGVGQTLDRVGASDRVAPMMECGVNLEQRHRSSAVANQGGQGGPPEKPTTQRGSAR